MESTAQRCHKGPPGNALSGRAKSIITKKQRVLSISGWLNHDLSFQEVSSWDLFRSLTEYLRKNVGIQAVEANQAHCFFFLQFLLHHV